MNPELKPQPELAFPPPSSAPEPCERVTIEGELVRAVSPEGAASSMRLAELVDHIATPRIDTCGSVLPDGVKCVIPIPQGSILVHQTPPRVHGFEWIAKDSPAPFGEGARYRNVSLALPYLVVLAVFEGAPGGTLRLGGSSECFFSNRPLDTDGIDTPLLFPALLNCSRFPEGAADKPLSWICVQNLSASRACERVAGDAIHEDLQALLHHLLESRFNLSSEHHEVSSWYSETVKAEVDPRLATVEAWEAASAEDPLFALEVPWLPTGKTLGEVAERIADARGGRRANFTHARDLMRVLFLPREREGRTR